MTLLMILLVLLVVFVVGGLAIVASSLAKSKPRTDGAPGQPLPYKRKDYLLSAAERSFYEVLRGITGPEMALFAKVRLLDLVWLPAGVQNRQGWINRVSAKHLDFVLCDTTNLRPLAAIELDDSSHDREDRQTRDAFVDQVCGAAGLPVLHIAAKKAYVPAAVASQIQGVLEGAR